MKIQIQERRRRARLFKARAFPAVQAPDIYNKGRDLMARARTVRDLDFYLSNKWGMPDYSKTVRNLIKKAVLAWGKPDFQDDIDVLNDAFHDYGIEVRVSMTYEGGSGFRKAFSDYNIEHERRYGDLAQEISHMILHFRAKAGGQNVTIGYNQWANYSSVRWKLVPETNRERSELRQMTGSYEYPK